MELGKRTPFYDLHLKANAKIVDFAGWEMPLHYGSQIEEHHQVRKQVGMFDVSHMGVVDVHGKDATAYLRYLFANDVDRLHDGKAFYTCMLNDAGGVIDDLIVYRLLSDSYRIVVNAGTRAKDLHWMQEHAKQFDVRIKERSDLAMLAVQGPKVNETFLELFSESERSALNQLKPFHFTITNDCFVARTGYTGEDGFEIIFPNELASKWWTDLIKVGVKPCGLGARDTLRLEAGLNLYGSDMDETVTPLESNLGWTVVMDPEERNFIGKQKLTQQKQSGVLRRLVGLVLEGPGIMRNHQKVLIENNGQGEVTSGGYSPTLEKSIALARVPANVPETCSVEIRNKHVTARVVKPPFVRHGKKMV